jgi:DNA-binding CsgD family transcriptional regulator
VRQIGAGLMILNEDGRINFMNRMANDMLHNSGVMSEVRGILAFNDPAAQARYASLLAQCISVSTRPGLTAGGVISAPRPNAASVGVMVVPYRNLNGPQSFVARTSRATLLIFDPQMARPAPPQILQDLYQLSDSELLVCWHLANGESVEETARAMEVSRETVRSQLKRIFAKTGVSRQPELVRMALLQPAFWAHARPAPAAEAHHAAAESDSVLTPDP